MLLFELFNRSLQNWNCDEYALFKNIKALECSTIYNDFELITIVNYGTISDFLNSISYEEYTKITKKIINNGIIFEDDIFAELIFVVNHEEHGEFYDANTITNIVKNDVYSVLSIILNKFEMIIENLDPTLIVFSAKNEKSRLAAYKKLIFKYKNKYHKIFQINNGDETYFMLIKKDRI